MSMFCFQCEQATQGTGCNVFGNCGKDPKTAALQDVLVETIKGIAMYAHRAAELGRRDPLVDREVIEALFATVTNVDFDPQRVFEHIRRASEKKHVARAMYEEACRAAGQTPQMLDGPAQFEPADSLEEVLGQAEAVSIVRRRAALGEDLCSLQEIVLYGIKGAAAYADHAYVLGREDAAIYAAFHAALNALTNPTPTMDELLGWAMKTGELNMKVMELLDAANTDTYGHPEPTQVRITPKKGKAILVSGHDLHDLALLLEQSEGKGINVYTHGEMLPCHAYPGLKKYTHLVGNYGGAWQDQRKEFDAFPGAILMTTNCIQKPKESYAARLFTSGLVAWPGVRHIGPDKDFSPVIDAALAASGFAEDGPDQHILVGFGRNAVLRVADKVIEAVKSGAIRRFFLVGGCDGAKPGRNYYTDFVQKVPQDCVILTLACGKYRFNKLDFGTIGGIPRLLDIGQCNDAYSAIQIAVALAKAFNCDVNDLPLSMVLSWYEQKAVAILLTLLYLGVKNIRLGPSLPAFVSPNVLKVLVEKFQIAPITTPEQDLKQLLGQAA